MLHSLQIGGQTPHQQNKITPCFTVTLYRDGLEPNLGYLQGMPVLSLASELSLTFFLRKNGDTK